MTAPAPSGRLHALGWTATAGSIVMYLSYIDQIVRNLHGAKGSLVLPAATTACCSLWFAYGWLRHPRDWPIVAANAPGVLLGIATFVTAL